MYSPSRPASPSDMAYVSPEMMAAMVWIARGMHCAALAGEWDVHDQMRSYLTSNGCRVYEWKENDTPLPELPATYNGYRELCASFGGRSTMIDLDPRLTQYASVWD